MPDTPMPETLESLAGKITALTEVVKGGFAAVDERFTQVDARFAQVDARLRTVEGRLDNADNRFTQLEASIGRKIDETRARLEVKIETVDRKLVEIRAHLGVEIEAVDTRVTQVYDAVIAITAHETQNRKNHKRFDKKLEDYDVRILAVEHRAPRKRRKGL